MDAQQRLLLEHSYEALGLLKGTATSSALPSSSASGPWTTLLCLRTSAWACMLLQVKSIGRAY